MAELTKDQIEAAAKVAHNASRVSFCASSVGREHNETIHSWHEMHEDSRQMWRDAIAAAVPLVQLPLDEPSFEEVKTACLDFIYFEKRDSTCFGVPMGPMRNAFSSFVRRRNALPNPNPKDARISMLVDLFNKNHPTMMSPANFAKDILELLDRKE